MIEVIWPADSQLARALVCVILGLLGWALLCAMRHAGRLVRESLALRTATARLRAWRQYSVVDGVALGAAGAAASEAYPRLTLAELRGKLDELRAAVPPRTHVAALLDTLRKLRVHRVKINLATLQQTIEHDEATRSGAGVPQQVANFAIMIGILGTFWGLGHMVRAIGVALPDPSAAADAATWTRSLGQVRTVLEGMRTAFSTSLVGITTAIIAGMCGAVLAARQRRLLAEIEAFTVNDLLPATVPTLDDDSVLEQASAQLATTFDRIDGIATQNLTSIQEFTAAQATFRALVDDIRAIAHAEANRDLDRVLDSVIASNQALLELLRRLPPADEAKRDVEAIRTMLAGTNQTLQQLAAALPRRFDPAPATRPAVDAPEPVAAPPAPSSPRSPRPPRWSAKLARNPSVVLTGLVMLGVGFTVAMLAVLR